MKIFTTLLTIFIFSTTTFCQTSSNKLEITQVKENFYVYTTYHDYKGTLFPANGLYLVTDDGVVLIDSPWDTTQFQPLLDSIQIRHNKKVVMCIATHSHEDRTAGLEFYKQQGIQTFTTLQTDLISQANNEKRAEFLIAQDTTFTVGQYTFQTFYPGAGHTQDNIVIWFGKDKLLYGGCLIKSVDAHDLGNLADADPKQWKTTIQNIQKKFGKPMIVIPGHQDWTNNRSLQHTLKLLRKYERKF